MWVQVENGDLLNTDHIVVVQKVSYTPTSEIKPTQYNAVAVTSIECREAAYPARARIWKFNKEKHCDEFITRLGIRINAHEGGDHNLKALVDDIMEDDSEC